MAERIRSKVSAFVIDTAEMISAVLLTLLKSEYYRLSPRIQRHLVETIKLGDNVKITLSAYPSCEKMSKRESEGSIEGHHHEHKLISCWLVTALLKTVVYVTNT
jgi:hypothetical protein